MGYTFLDKNIDTNNLILPESDKINPFLLKNNSAEIEKAIKFLSADEKLLYIHGFLGTGKRQIINYTSEFTDQEVIKLEYYCRQSTVCDDILLQFIDKIEKITNSKSININAKITTLSVKFQQSLSSITRPFLIILHSLDSIQEENRELVSNLIEKTSENPNVKIIISTRAMMPEIAGKTNIDRKVFLKGFNKEIFKEFLQNAGIECMENTLEDFYSYTRGYYYYTALTVKIIQAMNISLNEFLTKYSMAGMSFDSFLGASYVNLIPNTIRNFFWFLRTVRHGLSANALAVLELYDEFSVEYLKTNLMIFVSDDVIYVQEYFLQDIDISIPAKTETKLHKYIIGIYERELKAPLQTRQIMISRQAMRAEIEFHNKCIENILNGNSPQEQNKTELEQTEVEQETKTTENKDIETKLEEARKCAENNNPTKAIELYTEIMESGQVDSRELTDIRHNLAALYMNIEEYKKAQHYYELIEKYYETNNEVINLNYLYYEMTKLYYSMYKQDRAIETAKKVIYSVDTPQSLMVDACTLLGNIYFDTENREDAISYYKKALDSIDNNASPETLAELYFKYALVNDEAENMDTAMEYYIKCLTIGNNNLYKASAYSNLGSCYYENNNYTDAEDCFLKAYELEKSANNYDGIFYAASSLAKIYSETDREKALNFYLEAKQSAEFINEEFYILESTVALGDFYYDDISQNIQALTEYLKARKLAEQLKESVDISKIESRINDMKLRMDEKTFNELEKKYK